jgi:hypothetical protein
MKYYMYTNDCSDQAVLHGAAQRAVAVQVTAGTVTPDYSSAH